MQSEKCIEEKDPGDGERVVKTAFEYDISKAIDIATERDEAGKTIIRIDFRYVTFRLKLDDKLKTEKLVELLTGEVIKKEEPKKDVKLPRLYKS